MAMLACQAFIKQHSIFCLRNEWACWDCYALAKGLYLGRLPYESQKGLSILSIQQICECLCLRQWKLSLGLHNRGQSLHVIIYTHTQSILEWIFLRMLINTGAILQNIVLLFSMLMNKWATSVALVDGGWVFDKNVNQCTSMNILGYRRCYYCDYCTYFLQSCLTCCYLRRAQGEGEVEVEVGGGWQRVGGSPNTFCQNKKPMYTLVSKIQYFTSHKTHNIN